ncbi:TadE/TadG family type IV pilus assembly protein [Roseimaritima ulvae]|uniref:TadE-like protein n=1 Tax=Roseimaritima ulvae TaxID=980254 RepID=A0A5B9QQ21_9BACT|nr:TadE/TadG family type IV pilus assembly protein [Roseimaritima ulvae]QEG39615.1 TadE-like protein [Roseimaritima ulvae]
MQSSLKTRSGTTATELAVVLPLLVLVTLACSDFARVIQYRQLVANAARTGAHRGAMQQCTDYTRSDWEQQVRQTVVDELQHLEQFDASATVIAVESTEDLSGKQHAAVEVELPFDTMIAWPGLPSRVLLNHRAEFQHFR